MPISEIALFVWFGCGFLVSFSFLRLGGKRQTARKNYDVRKYVSLTFPLRANWKSEALPGDIDSLKVHRAVWFGVYLYFSISVAVWIVLKVTSAAP